MRFQTLDYKTQNLVYDNEFAYMKNFHYGLTYERASSVWAYSIVGMIRVSGGMIL